MSFDLTTMLDSFPEGWRPNAGDKLIGVVIGLESRSGEYGEYPIVSVRTDDGHDLAFHAFHTVARGELEKLPPKLGDRIGIAYHGPHPVKGYERYRIVIVRGAGEAAGDEALPSAEPGPDRSVEDGAPLRDASDDDGGGEDDDDGLPY
jgi:hypothetical protein